MLESIATGIWENTRRHSEAAWESQ